VTLTAKLPQTEPKKSTWRYPLSVLADCAEREAKERRVRYANRVLTGRMSHRFAEAEINKMAAIARELRDMAEWEKLL